MTGFKFKVKETRLNLCFEELGNSRKGQSSEAVLPPGLRQGKFISSCFHTSSATSSANFWPQYLNNGISIKAAWDRLLLCFCFTGNVLHLSVCTLCFLSSHTNLSLIPRIGQPLNAPLGLVLNHFKDFCQVTEDSSLFVCPNKLTIFWRNEWLTYKVGWCEEGTLHLPLFTGWRFSLCDIGPHKLSAMGLDTSHSSSSKGGWESPDLGLPTGP
jgi:hypothetical protein